MKTVSILPVIHFSDREQALRNAAIAAETGCDGVFLIQMQGANSALPRTGAEIKVRFPSLLVGANHLGEHVLAAVAANVAEGLDMTWTDEQLSHSDQSLETSMAPARERAPSDHILFCGVAFKHQKHEPLPCDAALRALRHGFIPTTSGSATGVAADMAELAHLRGGIGDAPLAVASGVTPSNFENHAPFVTHVLVATGVSSSFHEFDKDLLADLVRRRDAHAVTSSS